jgi:hypothetical protein
MLPSKNWKGYKKEWENEIEANKKGLFSKSKKTFKKLNNFNNLDFFEILNKF